jgi:Zn-dependent protease with chaperone function
VTGVGQLLLAAAGFKTQEGGDIAGSLLFTWGAVAAVVLAAWLLSAAIRRSLRTHPDRRQVLVSRQGAFRFYHFLALLVVYVAGLYLLGWGWVVQRTSVGSAESPSLFPGFELVIISPLLTALVASWLCFYDAEKALHAASNRSASNLYWTRWSYLTFHLRQNIALVFAPVLLLIILQQLAGIFSVVAAVAVLIGMPWIVRAVMGMQAMPDGELRMRLLAAQHRLRFRCSNILIWNTRGGVVNAMVIGILPFLRYVVLTDRLVAEMSPEEVEGVFGHEIGHIKHRHMWYYLAFIFMSFAVLAKVWQAAQLETLVGFGSRTDLALLPLAAVIALYVLVVFGFLSRRCERQADIYGCRAVSCGRRDCCGHESDDELAPGGQGLCRTGIHIFINALEKVAYLNGISRDRPGLLHSWQHSTIARRVDFLQHVLDDPLSEPRFQLRVGVVKWVLLVGLVSLLVLIGATTGWSSLLAF